jgi:hypothetical protein
LGTDAPAVRSMPLDRLRAAAWIMPGEASTAERKRGVPCSVLTSCSMQQERGSRSCCKPRTVPVGRRWSFMRDSSGSCGTKSWMIYCSCSSAGRHERYYRSGWGMPGWHPLTSARIPISLYLSPAPGPWAIPRPFARSVAISRRISRNSRTYGSVRRV